MWSLFEDKDSEIKVGHSPNGFWTSLATQRTVLLEGSYQEISNASYQAEMGTWWSASPSARHLPVASCLILEQNSM